MGIKHNNSEGLNEKKPNQSTGQTRSEKRSGKPDESRFEGKDQDSVEGASGEQGRTSGENFDKYPAKDKLEKRKPEENQYRDNA